jgi:hypothetical protein
MENSMGSKADPNRSDEDAVSEAPKVVEITGQPADDVAADGSDTNTASDDMGDDAASGG